MKNFQILPLMATFMLLSLACASPVPNVGLVIGNGSYTRTSPLPNPPRDAQAVGRMLDQFGWSVTTLSNLRHAEFDSVIEQFVERVAHAEQAIFFYAGHGMQIDGKNYIVPIDFEPTVEGLRSLIPLDEVLGRLARSDAQLVVVLDACRDNPLSGQLAVELASARTRGLRIIPFDSWSGAVNFKGLAKDLVIGRGLAELNVAAGTLIAYATQPGNVALDGVGEHSPFTEGLLANMGAVGQDVSGVLRHTRRSVIEATKGEQVPWDHSSLLEVFVINPRRTSPPPP